MVARLTGGVALMASVLRVKKMLSVSGVLGRIRTARTVSVLSVMGTDQGELLGRVTTTNNTPLASVCIVTHQTSTTGNVSLAEIMVRPRK